MDSTYAEAIFIRAGRDDGSGVSRPPPGKKKADPTGPASHDCNAA